MFRFLETDIREQNNTVNDLRYEIKFENCLKDKITFLLSKIYFILIFFFFFFTWQILKKIDMPR